MRVATAAQMREMDRVTIHERAVPGITLMERAGHGAYQVACGLVRPGGRVSVLCGRGNNGGDGFVIARLLNAGGCRVEVFLACEPSDVRGDAAQALEAMEATGLRTTAASLEALGERLPQCDLVVDALLGTGTAGEIREPYAGLIQAMADARTPVLAVDIPSGLHADTGQPLGPVAPAVATATFGLPKLGLLQHPGCRLAGQVVVVDIGIPPDVLESAPAFLLKADEVAGWLPRRSGDAHKGDSGRILIVASSTGLTGAACIAARAACRGGSGLVTVAVPADLAPSIEARSLESMTLPLRACRGLISEEAAPEILGHAQGCDAVAIGPGLGRSPGALSAVRRLLSQIAVPMVLDADGLHALRGAEVDVAGPLVLTPHPGEMAAILGVAIDEVQRDRVGAAQEAARRFEAVAVLKGARTVVADPEGRVAINPTGNAGMASGGMGDALTGVVTSLLGQGMETFEAACAGAFLHGLAGDYAAQSVGGEVGILASDLIEALPRARERVARGEGPPSLLRRL